MCRLCEQGKASAAFRLATPFSEGCGGDRDHGGQSQSVRNTPSGSRPTAGGLRQAGSPLHHSRRFRYVVGLASGRLRQGRRAGRGQENPFRRAEPASRRRGCDRRHRPYRHARVYRHAPSSVRDGTAQLPGGRDSDPRRLGDGGRNHDLLPENSADVRPGVPAARRLHQRAVRGLEPARRRCDDRPRRLANPPYDAALRRGYPGALRHRASFCVRLLRRCGEQRPQLQISL